MRDVEDLFRKYQMPLYAYILRMVRDPMEAEELTQETFVRACVGLLRFRGDSSVRTWLFGIGRNVVHEAARRRRPDALVADPADAAEPDPTDSVFLQHALSKLADDDREVLVLVDALGFSPAEFADMCDITPGAARVRLHRARKRFRGVVDGWRREDLDER